MQTAPPAETPEIEDASIVPDYENNIDGALKYLVDLSFAYKQKIRESTPGGLSAQLYTRKLAKNNRKLYQMLVKTPNSFNPFIEYIEQMNKRAADAMEEAAGKVLDRVRETNDEGDAIVVYDIGRPSEQE